MILLQKTLIVRQIHHETCGRYGKIYPNTLMFYRFNKIVSNRFNFYMNSIHKLGML